MLDLPAWLLPKLVCPADHAPLAVEGTHLVCDRGHGYAVRDGIPVLLRRDIEHTHEAALYALDGEEEPDRFRTAQGPIDPFVQEAIGATGGYLYADLIGRLTEYPIPELRLPLGEGRTFLDVGCSWGRWSIAAARLGYTVVGVDPSLVGIRAARRVARQLGVSATFLCADARYLPFASGTFDTAFSYSVIQHFSKADARLALADVGRVLESGGLSLIQMPNACGVRSLYHQARRGFREPRLFEVRYWTVAELQRTFARLIGPSAVTIDGFFSLNPQLADIAMLPLKARVVVNASEGLRSLARLVPALKYTADSLYVESRREREPRALPSYP